MTARLFDELAELWKASPKDPAVLVFGVKYSFKRAFKKACERAKVEGFRFHDGRHTATTRIVETNALHTQEAMKVTGHTQQATFARYVNVKDQTARRAAEALDALQAGAVAVENAAAAETVEMVENASQGPDVERIEPASDLIN